MIPAVKEASLYDMAIPNLDQFAPCPNQVHPFFTVIVDRFEDPAEQISKGLRT